VAECVQVGRSGRLSRLAERGTAPKATRSAAEMPREARSGSVGPVTTASEDGGEKRDTARKLFADNCRKYDYQHRLVHKLPSTTPSIAPAACGLIVEGAGFFGGLLHCLWLADDAGVIHCCLKTVSILLCSLCLLFRACRWYRRRDRGLHLGRDVRIRVEPSRIAPQVLQGTDNICFGVSSLVFTTG